MKDSPVFCPEPEKLPPGTKPEKAPPGGLRRQRPRAGAYTRPLFSSTVAVSDMKYTLVRPLICPDTSYTPPEQPLNAPSTSQKAFRLSRKVDECMPLPPRRELPLRELARNSLAPQRQSPGA
jgi:hypothetical protein